MVSSALHDCRMQQPGRLNRRPLALAATRPSIEQCLRRRVEAGWIDVGRVLQACVVAPLATGLPLARTCALPSSAYRVVGY